MSPSIATGPPHSRAASLHGNGPVATGDILRMNGASAAQGGKRVYPHIEDLINVQPNVDINSPIRKILQDAELLAKQADTHLDFRRPDIALQEHLQALSLVAETIPRHKDYPSLQTSQGDLHRKYTGLVKRIKAQEAKFDIVVRDIKEDNVRSGVLPTASAKEQGDVRLNGAPRNGVNSHSRNTSLQALDFDNASTTNENNARNQSHNSVPPNAEHVRKRPPVQPKPQALHGKALESSAHSPIPPQATDLTARFARLRSPAPLNITQDPRIRTQAITIPQNSQSFIQSPSTPRSSDPPTKTRPIGPREFPTAPKTLSSSTKAVLDVQIPDMPKPPDAIYSPAGNTDSAATINLPSSVNRNASYLSNGRKNSSAPPVSTATPTPLLTESMQDYFSPAHKADDINSLQNSRKRPDLGFLKDNHISAETLFNLLAKGLQVLLVDIRRREEFDRGHIMSKSIICIEPITIREGISADQLGESNVLSPDSEQKLYENRDNFDLLVYYDQSSSSTNARGMGGYNEKHYLEGFSKAVYEYGYEKRLAHRPLMLIGGLDAWVDLLGPNSLQTSLSLSEGSTKPANPLSRVFNTHDSRQRNHVPRSNSGRQSRLFTKEEESTWDETVKKDTDRQLNLDGQVDSEEFSYHKSTADFLRKYPELPSIQESMISTEPRSTLTRTSNQQVNDFDSVPKPPTRPAPALPRQRSSGINERGPSAAYVMTSTSNSLTNANPKAGLTGLGNNGVTCYANSVIQCLSATAALRQYLVNEYRYPTNPRPPKIESEPGPHPPQLLTRNLANLFTILWSGNYDWVMPKTLLSYINALNAKKLAPGYSAGDGFGGSKKQHDAHEFLTFTFEVLMDELNLLRDRPDFSTGRDSDKLQELSILDSSIHEWMRYQQSQSSFFSREFAGLMAKIVKCANCPYSSKTYDPMTAYQVYFPEEFHRNAPRRAGLQELLQSDINFGSNWDRIHGFTCEKCKKSEGFSLNRFAYLPNHLVLYFPRFQNNLGGAKIQTHIDLDLDSVDLRPFHITTEKDVKVPADADTGFQIPPMYQAYAAAMHRGKDVKYGHYVALTRNLDPTATGDSKFWHQYNDQIVSRKTLKDLEDDGFTIAVLFLRRKGYTRRHP